MTTIPTCATCVHFGRYSGSTYGVCALELPDWMLSGLGDHLPHREQRETREGRSCSFHAPHHAEGDR